MINIRDLLEINEAATKYNTDPRDILCDALEGKASLYVISDKDHREALVPCKDGPKQPNGPGEFLHQIRPYFDDIQYVDCSLGQPLLISARAIKKLTYEQKLL